MQSHAYREMAEQEEGHWWYVGRRHAIAETIRALSPPPRARILEVGAGTGGNLAMLKTFGTVSATEMDAYARNYATQHTGTTVLAGDLPHGLPAFEELFDVICLLDVLEHVEDDAATITTLVELLAPGGHLIVTVPAYQWLWSVHDETLHHFRRYRKRRLRALFQGTPVDIRRLTYFNAALLPLAASARLGAKLLRRETAPGTQMPSRPVNAALASIFRLETRLVGRIGSPFGLSLMAVAQRT